MTKLTEASKEQEAFIEEIVSPAAPHIPKQHVDSRPWGKKMVRMTHIALEVGIGMGFASYEGIKVLVHGISLGR